MLLQIKGLVGLRRELRRGNGALGGNTLPSRLGQLGKMFPGCLTEWRQVATGFAPRSSAVKVKSDP